MNHIFRKADSATEAAGPPRVIHKCNMINKNTKKF